MAILVLVLTGVGCATHALTSGRVAIRDDRTTLEVGFSERDRSIVRDYYQARARPKAVPPGLAKREALPPGLARRDTLPPGLQGRALPPDLDSRLTVLPSVYARLVFGRDLVLIRRDTRQVLDILYGVVPE
jgi:hypothetical protein